jgi:hypothetical protein
VKTLPSQFIALRAARFAVSFHASQHWDLWIWARWLSALERCRGLRAVSAPLERPGEREDSLDLEENGISGLVDPATKSTSPTPLHYR